MIRRALIVLATLAGTAHADDRDDLLRDLERSLVGHSGLEPPECRQYLAALGTLRIPESTTIHVRRMGRRPITLAAARRRCDELERSGKVDYMAGLIAKAVEFPWAWADKCVEAWPRAIAAGVHPTERVERLVPSRRGWIELSGTLQQLRVKWCDNAYSPRRRGE